MTIIWYMVPQIWSAPRMFLSSFTLLAVWWMKISKNWKKTPGDTIILHNCNKNRDHRLYCSWDTTCDRCNYFLFWAILFPFTVQKTKISKNEKNSLIYHHFRQLYQKSQSYVIVPEIWHVMDAIVTFQFEQFYGAWQFDGQNGQTDGKSDILRWVPT